MTGKEARVHAEAAIQRFRLLGKKPPIVDLDEVERKADVAAAAKHARDNAPLTRADFDAIVMLICDMSDKLESIKNTLDYNSWRSSLIRGRGI